MARKARSRKAVVSGAGDRAAIARGDAVDVYEFPGGRLWRTIAHGTAVNAVAFGGTTTGRDVVSGAVDGSLLVTRDGGARLALPAAPGGVDAVGFLSDGRVVAADAQRRLRVYDPDGAALADLEIPASEDGTLKVWDLETRRLLATLEGHAGGVRACAVTPDGRRVVSASEDKTLKVWDLETCTCLVTRHGDAPYTVVATSATAIVAGDATGGLWILDGPPSAMRHRG